MTQPDPHFNDGGKQPNLPSGEQANAAPSPGSPDAFRALQLGSQAVHAGELRQKPAHAVIDPIFCASTYSFPNTQALVEYLVEKTPRDEYARYSNPNERTAELKLAALEGAETAVLYSTGMSAIVGLMLSTLNAGDEVLLFDECYERTREFCTLHLSRLGIRASFVPTGDYAQLEASITKRTRLLFSESPTNPHLSVIDVNRFAEIGRRHGIATAVDATLATPYNIRPLEAGVTFVIHSCTKYLAGHNDLLAGVVLGSRECTDPLRSFRGLTGMINSPHNEYLLLRGLKTFELRMQRHNENGQRVAEFLAAHPRVQQVYYPGLSSHPQHEIARRTMRGFGGVVTFLVKDADWQATAAVVDAVRIPRIAPSLGGAESLIEQPLVLSYFDFTPEQRQAIKIPDNMIRLACGLENAADLIADLSQALQS